MTGLQARTGHRHVTERRTERERDSALAPETPAARLAVSVVSDERPGLGADHAFLDAGQHLPGLVERQTDSLELVVGLVQHQKFLVAMAAVSRIDP